MLSPEGRSDPSAPGSSCGSARDAGVQGEGNPPALAAGSSVSPAPLRPRVLLAVAILPLPHLAPWQPSSVCAFAQPVLREDLSSPATSALASLEGCCKAPATSLAEGERSRAGGSWRSQGSRGLCGRVVPRTELLLGTEDTTEHFDQMHQTRSETKKEVLGAAGWFTCPE